jgi:lantibiotic biosynthesis protein
MRNQPDFRPSGFFVLRTPLLPLHDWLTGSLREVVERPAVQEALFLASPALFEQLPVWRRQPESERGRQVELSLARYLARMAGRSTPFGLFAGCSTGALAQSTCLRLSGQASYRRHTRLDVDYVQSLTEVLNREEHLLSSLRFRPNSSIYRLADRIRYAEARPKGRTRAYHLVGVEPSPYLDLVLERARDGALLSDLAAALIGADSEVSLAEAEAFLAELVESQILLSDLMPTLTGEDPARELITLLAGHAATAPIAQRLDEALSSVRALDQAGPGQGTGAYRAIAEQLAELPARVDLPRLFQVDMTKPVVAATLGPGPLAEVARGVDLLRRITHQRSTALDRFRDAFVARYERRELPLVEVLDEESGLGFNADEVVRHDPTPLLEGIGFAGQAQPGPAWGPKEAWLLGRLSEALMQGQDRIDLTEADLTAMAAPGPVALPDAFSVMTSIAAADEAAIDRGEYQVLFRIGAGPSGARWLGRFCSADAELRDWVEQHLREEERLRPDAIFAEIVCQPDGRGGNVALRPVLRGYEIPFLGRSGAPPERQIPVSDLLVSVVGDRVRLRSARLGREVIPRMTSAHNFNLGLPIYQFLCQLQAQGVTERIGWDWGPLESAPYLPRVTAGRLVLSRASWRLSAAELRALQRATAAERSAAAQALRKARRLPRLLAVTEGDNELPLDLDNALSVDVLAEMAGGRSGLRLTELFPGPEALPVTGPEGAFVHELVIPFVRREPAGNVLPEGTVTPRQFARAYPPGSEWLYARLYCGHGNADRLLREVIAPLKEEALQSAAADRWFFIRYGDPDWHVRLRFHGDPRRLGADLLPRLHDACAPWLADGRLSRIELGTYEPECERYGGPVGLLLSEQLFAIDSDAVLDLLRHLRGDAGLDARWRLALIGTDLLLGDLGFDLPAKAQIIQAQRDAFAAEFRVDGPFRGRIGDRFRQERRRLEQPEFDLTHLRLRSRRLEPVAEALRTADRAGRLSSSLPRIAAAHVHMHINRLLRGSHRIQELVIYDFLTRLYQTQLARGRGEG